MKNYLAQNVNSAETEKLGYRGCDGQLALPILRNCFEDKQKKDANVLGFHKLI